MKKNELYRLSLMEVGRIHGLSGFHTVFLATMLLRKMRHPGEKLRETTFKTMKKMETRYSKHVATDEEEEKIRKESMKVLNKTEESYGKTEVLSRPANVCFDELDSALDSVTMPKEWNVEGYSVESVIKYMMQELPVFIEVSKIKGLNDEYTKFLSTMVINRRYSPKISIWDNVWRTMNELHVEEVYDTTMSKEEKIEKYWDKLGYMLEGHIPEEWEIKGRDVAVAKKVYEYLTTD